MDQKEKWIESTLNVENTVGKIKPSDALLEKLRAIPSRINESTVFIPKKIVWAAAASIAILVCLNLYSTINYKTSKETISQNEVLSETYFSYLKQL